MVIDEFDRGVCEFVGFIMFTDLIQYFVDRFRGIKRNQFIPEFFDTGQSFQVVCIMPAHFIDANNGAFPADGFMQVFFANTDAFFQ